jgi:hypothetical protein
VNQGERGQKKPMGAHARRDVTRSSTQARSGQTSGGNLKYSAICRKWPTSTQLASLRLRGEPDESCEHAVK